jgi:hypothetical protein
MNGDPFFSDWATIEIILDKIIIKAGDIKVG